MPVQFDLEIPNAREGLFVPHEFATSEQVVEVIVKAEELGFNAVWATDFFSPAASSNADLSRPPVWFEPLMVLAYAAARTRRIKLGTGVLMLPYRAPTVLAKQVATLDQLSNGRLLLGIGLGAYRDEFAAVRAHQAKVHRGNMMDEYLELLQRLLDDEPEVTFKGKYVAVENVSMHPKPIQQPLPIYLPGRGEHAYKRIARWGLNVMVPASAATSRLDELRPFMQAQNRDISTMDVIAEAEFRVGKTNEAAATAYQKSTMGQLRTERAPPASRKTLEAMVDAHFIGSVERIIEKMNICVEQGISHFNLLHIAADSLSERLDQMQQFAEEVMPNVG